MKYCRCKKRLRGIFGLKSKLYLCRNCGRPIKEKDVQGYLDSREGDCLTAVALEIGHLCS